MRTYYIGILMDFGLPTPTEVFDTADECEDHCLTITDDYYVIMFEVNEPDFTTH